MNALVEVHMIDGGPRLRIDGEDWQFNASDVTELRSVAWAINEAHRRAIEGHRPPPPYDVRREVF